MLLAEEGGDDEDEDELSACELLELEAELESDAEELAEVGIAVDAGILEVSVEDIVWRLF